MTLMTELTDEALEELMETQFGRMSASADHDVDAPVAVTPVSIQRDSGDDVEEYHGQSEDEMDDIQRVLDGVAPVEHKDVVPSYTAPPVETDMSCCHVCLVAPRPGVTLEGLVGGRSVCQVHATCTVCAAPRHDMLSNLINIEGRLYHRECLQCSKCMVDLPCDFPLRQQNNALYCPNCGPCECGTCDEAVFVGAVERGGDGALYSGSRILFEHRRCDQCGERCNHDYDQQSVAPRPRSCLACKVCIHDTAASVGVLAGGPNLRATVGSLHIRCAMCFICERPFTADQRVVMLDGKHPVHMDCISCAMCHLRFHKSVAENIADRVSRPFRGVPSGWVHYVCRRDADRAAHAPRDRDLEPTRSPKRASSSRSSKSYPRRSTPGTR